MTTRTKTIDGRYTVVGTLSTATTGPYTNKNQVGGNWALGEARSTPHGYAMSSTRFYQGVYKRWYKWDPTKFGWLQVTKPGRSQRAWSNNDQIDLINKLRARYDTMDFNSGVAGSELGKATDMLANNLRQMGLAYKQARRGNFRAAAETLKASSSAFKSGHEQIRAAKAARKLTDAQLEVQYGFRALAGDIYDLSEALHSSDKRKRRISARVKIQGNVIVPTTFAGSGSSFISRSIIGYLESDEAQLPERLGLANPASILWENTPLSFALDWALPIGDWIDAQSFVYRARGVFVTSTFDYFYVGGSGFGVDAPYDPSPWGFDYEPPGRWFYEDISLSRGVTAGLPGVPLPGLKSSLLGGEPLNRVANAFSVLANLLGKGKG